MSALALLLTTAACLGAPVRADGNGSLWVHAGPFSGGVTAYDVVRGRFALRVGAYRTTGGLSQKIPWFPDRGTRVGSTLVVSGRTLSLPRRSFRQTFQGAIVSGRTMFPTIVAPPSTGCWLLTFTSGPTVASIAVTVRPRPRD